MAPIKTALHPEKQIEPNTQVHRWKTKKLLVLERWNLLINVTNYINLVGPESY